MALSKQIEQMNKIEDLFAFANQEVLLRGDFTHFSIDSRDIGYGDVFVAICGNRVDGHDFVKDVEKKASMAIVEKRVESSLPQLVVKNTVDFLQKLAKTKLIRSKAKVLAITGGIGKTTTKELIYSLLKDHIDCMKSERSFNTKITVPLSILNSLSGNVVYQDKWLILEQGQTHINDLAFLTEIAPADRIVTTTMPKLLHHYNHAKNFQSVEEIYQGKKEIFLSKKCEFAICQDDDFKDISQKRISYSITSPSAEYYASVDEMLKVYHKQKLVIHTPIHLPKHHLANLLAAIATAHSFGLDFNEIQKKLKNIHLPQMRFEIMREKGMLFINDSYNANPYTFIKAFENLPDSKRKIAVLGHMTELGSESNLGHKEVLLEATKAFDIVFCLGQNWDENLVKSLGFYLFMDQNECKNALKKELRLRDLVFFKGARAVELDKMLKEITQEI